jgi:hypothetical protein
VTNEASDRVSFLDRPLPSLFHLRVVVLQPGCSEPYDSAEWLGALVVLERGALEIECTKGRRRALSAGAVFWLAGLPLRALHNPGTVPAVLSAVSRARDEFPADPRLYVVTEMTTDKEGKP